MTLEGAKGVLIETGYGMETGHDGGNYFVKSTNQGEESEITPQVEAINLILSKFMDASEQTGFFIS